MRELLVKTKPGTGNNYIHPAKPNFNNPITAVHFVGNEKYLFKFETADGVIGAHPAS